MSNAQVHLERSEFLPVFKTNYEVGLNAVCDRNRRLPPPGRVFSVRSQITARHRPALFCPPSPDSNAYVQATELRIFCRFFPGSEKYEARLRWLSNTGYPITVAPSAPMRTTSQAGAFQKVSNRKATTPRLKSVLEKIALVQTGV